MDLLNPNLSTTSAVIFQIQSVCIFILLSIGIYKRKERKWHIPLMASAIVWDILLILQIELNRSAVMKASKAMENPMLLNIHVALALSSVFGYLFLLFSGRELKIFNMRFKKHHKWVGISTYILRFLTLVTSFFVVIPK